MNFSSTETVISVNWSPPDISLELSYTYCVNVCNASNSEVLITTHNVTTLEFIFTMVNPNPDDMFEIFIYPVTSLYPGEVTSVLAHFIGGMFVHIKSLISVTSAS